MGLGIAPEHCPYDLTGLKWHAITGSSGSNMKMPILVLGVVVLIAGIGTWGYLYSMNMHHTIQLGGLGLAVLGAIIAVGGAMMKRVSVGSTTGTGQFACAKCGAKFGSEAALNQHTKDKHGM